MKTKSLLAAFMLIFSLIATDLSAQEKKFRFEFGINYPIGLKKDGFEENRIGVYLKEVYNIPNSAFSVDLNLSFESYTIFPNNSRFPYDGRSVAVISSAIYNFKKEGWVKPYVGLGAGVSIDNIGTGVFNSGYKHHLAIVPKAGIRIFNHINITAMYYLTHEDFSRLMIGCGYTF